MTEWKEYKLGEIAEILDYKRKPLSSMERSTRKGIYPYYGASGIIDSIDDYIFDGEHILISEDGENLRTRQTPIAFLANGKFWVNNHAHILKADYVHSRLICYYFAQLDLNPYITGAVQPKLSQESLNRIPLYLPTLIKEREKIVFILSSLDDKIDLLHRENATLEQMAETMFRQWFVEESKEEWEEGKLGDYVEIKRGGSPRPISDYVAPSGYRWLKISDVTNLNSPYVYKTKEYIIESGLKKTVYLKEGSLVLSNSATPGIPKILCVDSCIHDGWLYFPKSKFSKYFLYLFFKSIRNDLINLGNGSIFTNLKTDILKDYKISVPDDESLLEFEKLILPLFGKLKNNTEQILSLSNYRDLLMSKLMSGEIEI